MRCLALAALLLACGLAQAASPHPCAPAASRQALQLLKFHAAPDDRPEIDKAVSALPPLRNPANKAQAFDVLEVWGYIYKAQYRMRLIYAQLPGDCVLMGQEILEYAKL